MPSLINWDRVWHLQVFMFQTPVAPADTSHSQATSSKVIVQDEKGVDAKEAGRFFVTGATDAVCKPSHLMSPLLKRRVPTDAWPPWSSAAFPMCQTFLSGPAAQTQDTWLAGTAFWGKPLQWRWITATRWGHSSNSSDLSAFGIESIFLPRIPLLMILGPRMPHCQCLQKSRHWSKCCHWAALSN